jgi:hypothetical protein
LQHRRRAISTQVGEVAQMELFSQAETIGDREEQRQLKLDHSYMKDRIAQLDKELGTEPGAIQALYEVRTMRLSPVGLGVGWPEALT